MIGRLVRGFALVAFTTAVAGCSICSNCHDESYAAYGGRWERVELDRGRLGSAFDPAGQRVEETPDASQPAESQQ